MHRSDRIALTVLGVLLVVIGVVAIATGVDQGDGWTVMLGGVAMLFGAWVVWRVR